MNQYLGWLLLDASEAKYNANKENPKTTHDKIAGLKSQMPAASKNSVLKKYIEQSALKILLLNSDSFSKVVFEFDLFIIIFFC